MSLSQAATVLEIVNNGGRIRDEYGQRRQSCAPIRGKNQVGCLPSGWLKAVLLLNPNMFLLRLAILRHIPSMSSSNQNEFTNAGEMSTQ